MSPHSPVVSRLVVALSSRGSSRFAALGTLTVVVAGLALGPRMLGTAPHLATHDVAPIQAGDTMVVYGPRVFDTPTGSLTHHVERFALVLAPGRRYTLRIQNGAADGTRRAARAELRVNGKLLVPAEDVATGREQLIPLEPQADNTLEVTVSGSPQAFVLVAVVATADPTYTIYGPQRFNVGTTNTTVTVPASAHAPYYLVLTNGEPDGSGRVKAVVVTLNGVRVVQRTDVTTEVVSLTRSVNLQATNTLKVEPDGVPGTHIYLRFTATDDTPPVLTITAPAPNFITRETQLAVTGTLQDQTAVAVTVNGTPATVSGTSFSGTAQLTTEGTNTIHVVATDAAGLSTDSSRAVIRDTQQPVLTVNAPVNNSYTNQTSVTVSGTVTDATPVTVNANGVPLPVDGAGVFTGSVPLAEGPNILTVTATDAAGNQQVVVRNVTCDTQAPVLTVTAPVDGAVVNADHVTVSGTVTDATLATVTANGTPLPVAQDGTFSGDVPLVEGPNTIAVVATDSATNSTTVTRSVTRQSQTLPPDPATVATPIDPTVATSIGEATAFLYTGPNPIQTGVAPGTINLVRAAVVRGKVLTRDGQPLSGATITIHDHPEYGQTLSRADGMFDLAVNGGERFTVDYAKSGFLPGQRAVETPWQDYTVVSDAALIPVDAQVTTIAFTQPIEVARGSVVTDGDGTRQATLLFKQGTQATMVMPDGSTQPLATIHVRATEYTVGPNGPKAMPAELPPTSAYTYAVEFSADEAIAAGAKTVQFSQPVSFYVENFLNFPVGGIVPVGFYERDLARWVPSDNGRVIKILSVTGGLADLDVDGSGQPAGSAALAALGITDAERQQLATLYQPGQSLWRIQTTHFSPCDPNWPKYPPEGAVPADTKDSKRRPDEDCHTEGSDIACEDQTLGETIGLAGTPVALRYNSNRVEGRKGVLDIPLSGATLPPGLLRIDLEIGVAGRLFVDSFPALPNQRTEFMWDGRDAYGRLVRGATPGVVRIGYVYRPVWAQPATNVPRAFGAASGRPISTLNPTRNEITLWQVQVRRIGTLLNWDALGGWGLTAHHAYDPNERALHFGDGRRRTTEGTTALLELVAGDGIAAFDGDDQPAVSAEVGGPPWVKVTADGSIYVADQLNHRIRKITPDGIIHTVAGNGQQCSPTTNPCGDNGPALQARLNFPTGFDFGPDGSLYIADQADHRIRRVTPDGVISTFAGTGVSGFSGDTGLATAAKLGNPFSVAVSPDGSVYIADNTHMRRVGPDGIISSVVGTSTPTCTPSATVSCDGLPATEVAVGSFFAIVGPDGAVYFSEGFFGTRLRRLTPDGILQTVAGNGRGCTIGTDPLCGDGRLATNGPAIPWGMTFGPDGALYFAELGTNRIRRVGPDRIITSVAGVLTQRCLPTTASCGEGGPARAAKLGDPSSVGFGPDGSMYIAELDNHKIHRVRAPLPRFAVGDFGVASEDGSVLYRFDANGRHQETLDSRTSVSLARFEYDSAGRLVAIIDRDSLVTRVERASSGIPTALVSPFGLRTSLDVDANGHLARITNPAGESIQLRHAGNGLLDTLLDARGNAHRFFSDTLGRLLRDEDPDGGFKVLARTATDTSFEVSVTTALGRRTAYRVEQPAPGGTRRVVAATTGLEVRALRLPDGSATIALPDGMVASSKDGPEPRFGMQSPLVTTLDITTPGGVHLNRRRARIASLADPGNPLSLLTETDSVIGNGRVTTTTYDAATRLLTVRSPEGRQTLARVDDHGRFSSARIPGFDSVSYVYDAQGRMIQRTQGIRTLRARYDALGRLDSIIDPVGRVTAFERDSMGRVLRGILPGGRDVRFAYDLNGFLISTTPAGRPAYTLERSAIGLLSSVTLPDAGDPRRTMRFFYDLDHELTSIIRPEGDTVRFTYDSAGRPDSVVFASGFVRSSYSPTTGHLSSIRAPDGGTMSLTYDGMLPTGVAWAGTVSGSVQAGYDSDYRVRSLAVNGNDSVAFQYDGDGLLVAAGDVVITRDPANGLATGATLGNLVTGQTWTTLAQLATYDAAFGGSGLYQTTFTRDTIGRITTYQETIQGQAATLEYGYDPAGRLAEVRRNGSVVAAYEYDTAGNRLSFTGPSGTLIGSYDAQDRLLSYGGTSYSYSPSGALLERVAETDTTRFNYDELGQLRSVHLPDGGEVEYIVDGQGRRIGKKVNGILVQGFLYEGLRPVAELDGANLVVSRFVYGTKGNAPDYFIKGGVTYGVISDHVGSVRLVVNLETGHVVQRIDYDEFGRMVLNTNAGFQPFGFAGGIYDVHTGLTRLGVRDYDAYTGRFTTRDPVWFAGGSNLYAYSSDEPINRADPSGLAPCDCSNPLLAELDRDVRFDVDPNAGVNPKGSPPVRPYFAPKVAQRISQAIRGLNRLGITPQINSGYRTAADQQWIRVNHRGKTPVAKRTSLHQLGDAADLNGTDTEDFDWIIGFMSLEEFDWGGLWEGDLRDDPHFQFTPPSADRERQAREIEDFFQRCLQI
jgi:RHS repeat-associated protein